MLLVVLWDAGSGLGLGGIFGRCSCGCGSTSAYGGGGGSSGIVQSVNRTVQSRTDALGARRTRSSASVQTRGGAALEHCRLM